MKYKLKRDLNRNSEVEDMGTEMKISLGELCNLTIYIYIYIGDGRQISDLKDKSVKTIQSKD